MPTRSETGRKVYVTNLGFHDYTPAKRYGDIIPCTRGNLDIRHTDRVEAELQSVLAGSEDEDFLLISGHPLIVALCVGYWFRLHRTINILYWDPLVGDYLLRPTEFASKVEQIEMLLGESEFTE